MFQRRNKLSLVQMARNFLWPRIGWHRSTKYVMHRVSRLRGTPYALAAGFACGAAISFTPFVGLHFLLSACLGHARQYHRLGDRHRRRQSLDLPLHLGLDLQARDLDVGGGTRPSGR